MKRARIIVVGTSAGGMDALSGLVAQLPPDLPAAVVVVQHMAPDADAGVLTRRLAESGSLRCTTAQSGDTLRAGHVFVAPADSHLLVSQKTLVVTKGARENRYRPAIDPLFRSAAVSHGSRVISVVLTGLLDDGTEGTTAVRRCGGITVAQLPEDAAYPDMPRSAARTGVHHVVPLRAMGALLDHVARTRPSRQIPIPSDVKLEAAIAERVLSDVEAVESLGKQVPYNCPNCGGVLWKIHKSKTLRYRCHTGHSFTAATLSAEQVAKIEETLWVALRMLEERRNLLLSMNTRPGRARTHLDREKDVEVHIGRIRAMLVAGTTERRKAPKPRRGA